MPGRARAWRAALAGAVLSLGACAGERGERRLESPWVDRGGVPYYYGVGLAHVARVRLDDGAWAWMGRRLEESGASAELERRAMGEIVARFEREAGTQCPAWKDKPRGLGRFGEEGQLDCVDESTNTTMILDLLEREGWLAHHEVMDPAWRFAFLVFDPHRTAVVRERASGRRYAVDSWVGGAGDEPDVLEISRWRRGETARD